MELKVIDAATGAKAKPTLATDGVAINNADWADDISVLVDMVVSGGAASLANLRVHVFSYFTGFWYALGTGAMLDRGKLNQGVNLSEEDVSDNFIHHEERIVGLKQFDRVDFSFDAPGGTDPEVTISLIGRSQPRSR